jgi:hypothetical protein
MLRGANFLPTVLLSFAAVSIALQSQAIAQEPKQRSSGTPYEFSSLQREGASEAGYLSEPYRRVWCPEVRAHGKQPNWAHGYFAQVTGETSAQLHDREGKLVSEARIWFPDALQITLFDVSPSVSGGVVASGFAGTEEGSTSFLAKTDASGATVSLLRLPTFVPGRVCQARDDTIWTFGRDIEKESANDHSYPLVHQYSFEKGLLNSYLSRETVALRTHAAVGGGGSFLVCGSHRISLYLNQTDEYIEIDPDAQSLQRWKMDMAPLAQARVTGLAVTENGRVYASLYELEPESERKTHGLFELRAEPGKTTAKWFVVRGTLNSHREGEAVPKGTFWRLWGAEGDDLIIGEQYDAEFSWVRVIR